MLTELSIREMPRLLALAGKGRRNVLIEEGDE